MSTHAVKVVKIDTIKTHPNADALELIEINGWQVVARKGQFKSGDLAIYIEPDYVVPTTRPEFAFLAKDGKTEHRLKAIRLRKALSFGLLIEIPWVFSDWWEEGDDVMEALGIHRYEPPVTLRGADELPSIEEPSWLHAPKFDVENLKHYPNLFGPDDEVIITEKIHGANARYLFSRGKFYMGSRNRWLKPEGEHAWKQAVDNDPLIKVWCEVHEDTVLYGEIYGPVQSLRYGLSRVGFLAFAAIHKGTWIDTDTLHNDHCIKTPPVLYRGPFGKADITTLAEADSKVGGPGHMMEGVVIVPAKETMDPEIGRLVLKYISNRYWESAA